MDVESDDSERWEDFFGSSTDLAPSLIGLYDSLNGSLNSTANSEIVEVDIPGKKKIKPTSSLSSSSSSTETLRAKTSSKTSISSKGSLDSLDLDSSTTVPTTTTTITNSNSTPIINNHSPSIINKSRGFRVLSPNVQRLISHSGGVFVEKLVDRGLLQCNSNNSKKNNNNISNNNNNNNNNINNITTDNINTSNSINNSCNNSSNITLTSNNTVPNNSATGNKTIIKQRIIGKQKFSHIPLSRNTCKLTQSNGNELVETFDIRVQSSTESLDRIHHSNHNQQQRQQQEQQNSVAESIKHHQNQQQQEQNCDTTTSVYDCDDDDDDKTPTNNPSDGFYFNDNQSDQKCVNLLKNASQLTKKYVITASVSQSKLQQNTKITNSINTISATKNISIDTTITRSEEKQESLQQQQQQQQPTRLIAEMVKKSHQSTAINDIQINSVPQSPELTEITSTIPAIPLQKGYNSNPSIPLTETGSVNDIKDTCLENPSSPIIDHQNANKDNQTNLNSAVEKNTNDLPSPSLKLCEKLSPSRKLTPPSTPLLTYARVKSLAAKNSIIFNNSIGLHGKLQRKLSAESLTDELTIMTDNNSMKKKTSCSTLGLSLSPKGNRKSGLMLPEIARLKHRPLSSSSICSTSSSSSSGSEHHIGNKLGGGISYLASVESLADQSENELVDGISTLTVFERTCLEIIDSERSYVEDLRQVITGYLEDWKERACLKIDELKVLFSNIQDIYEFNSILLKQLINSGMDPVKIAKCFIDLKDRFDVYTTYCTSYPEAISLLTSLLQASHTNALLTSTQKMLQHTLPLGSYLLKPVQRILKYHLLLDNLYKHCDIEEVVQAHEIMREVARNIDQVKKKLEQQSRVKELSGILDGWLGPELTVLGELRQEGLLMENNKPRMVFLFQTMLIITKPKEDNRLQFKSYIYRNNLMLREHLPGEPTSFNVIPYDEPRNQIKLTAKNRDQKRLWAQHIKGVILEQFDIPNRAKELVFKLGDEEDRTPDKNIWNIWNSNSSTPVYLERRNQYRRSEMRNRSKIKRKTITNSSSFDTFNEHSNNSISSNNLEKTKLIRNRSMDDNMIQSLPKFVKDSAQIDKAATIAARITKQKRNSNKNCNHTTESSCNYCNNNLLEKESIKDSLRLSTNLKERSKSVPRISHCHTVESDDDYNENFNHSNKTQSTDSNNVYQKFSTLRKNKTLKGVDIKMYNTKTIPKRIANLKKSRVKKETSKFYMDLDEMDTVLKITESTDNLSQTSLTTTTTTTTMGTIVGDNDGASCDNVSNNDYSVSVNSKEIENHSIVNKEQNSTEEIANGLETHDLNQDDIEKGCGESKNDVEIISELLKEHKELRKILKKPPKKKSFDNGRIVSSPEPLLQTEFTLDTPPPPPSNSPPPLEVDDDNDNGTKHSLQRDRIDDPVHDNDNNSEHVYETLLRNVHVPYKFSPVLNRSKSQQYYTNTSKEIKVKTSQRPESDYVTLIYTECGNLKSIEGSIIRTINNNGDTLRNSDSNINYENIDKGGKQSIILNSPPTGGSFTSINDFQKQQDIAKNQKTFLQRFMGSKMEQVTVTTSENSLLPRIRKSADNISLPFGKHSNKPPERRVSDVSEMCRQSIIHKQGSEAVGERIAHLDYVDPRTLFTTYIGRGGSSVSNSAVSLNPQRDSVFSLTSSSDSVCDSSRKKQLETIEDTSPPSDSQFIYEDTVEACLENDFRDSAVYSDDSERRQEILEDNDMSLSSQLLIKRPSSPPPPPPPPRPSNLKVITTVDSTSNLVTTPRSAIPPPIPAKPSNIPLKRLSSVNSSGNSWGVAGDGENTVDNVRSPNGNECSGKSWVLQQIENFNK